jgi:DNA-binding CsgD family transcriptional regulator
VGDGRYEEAIEVLGTQLEPHTTAEPKYGDVMLMWGARAAAELAVRARDRHDGPGQQHASAAVESLLTAREALPEGAFGGAHDDAFDGAMKAIFEAEHARCRGDADVAGRWEQAAAACAAAGTPWFEALASLRAAEARMAGGEDRARVAEPLRAAYRLATRMGAEPLREEAEAHARSAKISLLDPATVNATNTPTTALTRLTGRELEILRHLVAGRSYREIATALFISEKTVSAHVSNLLRKTGTRNRHEAAALARRHGVVVEPE